MPTIVKISMDASEYNKQLDEVMARTRAAQEKMAAVTVPSASGMPQSAAEVSAASAGSAQNISVSAEVSGLEDVQELSEAVRALPSEKEVRIAATVDSGGLSKAREKAKEVSSGMIQISKDTEKVNDKNKSISTGIQSFGQRAKAALKDLKSDLLSGNSALRQLKGGILSLLNPWSLVIAAAGALLTVGKEVWDILTVSAQEYAERCRVASEEAQKQADKIKVQDEAAQGYMARLSELAAAESIGNASKTETLQLLENLESMYGDLGAVIDETTGKVTNLAEVEAKLNAQRNRKTMSSNQNVVNNLKNEAKAAYMEMYDVWNKPGTAGQAGKRFDEANQSLTTEQLLAMFKKKRAEATTTNDQTKLNEIVQKLEAAVEAEKKNRQLAKTGYATEAEYQQTMARKSQQVGQAMTTNTLLDRSAARKKADAEMNYLRDSDDKIANRRGLIDEAKKRQAGILTEVNNAQKALDSADTPEKKLDAQKRLLDAQAKYKRSQAEIADLENQVRQIQHEQAEGKRKLTEQSDFELKYQKLLAAGEYDKAAGLKLEKELRDQNLKLTEAETRELQEQRKILNGLNLRKNLREQAQSLKWSRMEAAGQGEEAARQKALRDAEKTKGGKLTEAETKLVEKLSSLQFAAGNAQQVQLGDLSIKTNSLTSRGGFQGGVKMPDTEKIARETCNYNKRQADAIDKIKRLLENLEKD